MSHYSHRRQRQEGYGGHVCTACDPNIRFPTMEALMKHKAEKRKADPESHVHCKHCGDDFITLKAEWYHIQEVS